MKLTEHVYLVGSGCVGISNEYDCHVYLIDGGTELALVDAGAGVDPEGIVENVKEEGLDPQKLKKVFLTHVHPDHAGGAAWFKNNLGVDVYVSAGESRLLSAGTEEELGLEIARKSGGYYPEYVFQHCEGESLEDEEVVCVGNLCLKTIITPGHSLASACFLLSGGRENALFSGDTVMMNGMIGLLNCPGFSMDMYRDVTAKKLSQTEPQELFPGHMMFILKNGKEHLKKAVDNLNRIGVPSYIGKCWE